MIKQLPRIIMEEITDPEKLAKARRERCDRNSAWL